MKLSGQKKAFYAAEKEKEEIQIERREFREEIRDICPEDLIFVDRAGVGIALVRLDARALKGKRARGKKAQKRGKRVSLLSALSRAKVLVCHPVLAGVNGVTFEAFIVICLVPLLWKGAKVMMDNAKIHLGSMVL